ncbi:anhydro-N-acetylmuramic acid kinase [Marinobacter salicampi]|uniref:anhydro-N-acetylmuramic acid kinase n=1 Tax=Marinobacter salicampi TaxID=435907 RepID=UPI0014084E4A|nr:anhydro-N-acetylmuramic acid kinase [Marinobacter salicampi]
MDDASFVGLMSGTSMDGIDAVLVSFPENRILLHATFCLPYPHELRERLERLSQNHGSPDDLGEMDHQLGQLFGQAACEVIKRGKLSAPPLRAIGSHGQTIRHQPHGHCPFSIQLGDPNLISELTGVTTIADFRRRDMAAGGEGAPLVPAFHQAYFGKEGEDRYIINIGGIANISWLPGQHPDQAFGFDTGPGNALLDAWCLDQTGRHFDEEGRWARGGKVDEALLNDMLTDGYFRQSAPKSTGKEKFNLAWIKTVLNRHPETAPVDVQRTLLELTVRTLTDQLTAPASTLYVCGGGVKNTLLMETLASANPERTLVATDTLGLDPQWVEATAFAWLGKQAIDGAYGNVPKVTGAKGRRILGAIYQA